MCSDHAKSGLSFTPSLKLREATLPLQARGKQRKEGAVNIESEEQEAHKSFI